MSGDGAIGVVVLVGLLAMNHLILAIAGKGTWRWLFWAVQFINLGAAVFLLTAGLPRLAEGLWIASWFIALLFVWHIVLNNSRRACILCAAVASPQDDEDRRETIRRRLGSRGDTPHGGSP